MCEVCDLSRMIPNTKSDLSNINSSQARTIMNLLIFLSKLGVKYE
jgi:hypothetical protein